MTEVRPLEVHVISAHNLKDAKTFGKMHTYVVAWVDPRRKFSTEVEKPGGTSPVWDEKLVIPVEQHLLDQSNAMLMLQIYTHGLLKTKEVGYAQVPISDIKSKEGQRLDYPVQLPKGGTQGTITLSVTLAEKISVPAPAPVYTGRSAPVPGAAPYPAPYGYPPQHPPEYGYPPQYPPQYPPPGGYPPQAPEYGYPPQYPPPGGYPPQAPAYYSQPPPPGRNRFGGGFGGGAAAGAAGGLLGGFLLGDLVGSASDWGDGGGNNSGDDGGGNNGGDDGGGYGSDGGGDYGGGDF